MRPRLAASLAVLVLAGCNPALAPLLSQVARSNGDKTQIAAVPVQDGSQYVSVITKAPATPTAVRQRWKREAERACDGEYVVLSENAASQRTGAVTARLIHEGFVRCVSPEATLAADDRPASDRGRSDVVPQTN
ncbi:MAG: hypothetical protein IPH07_13590 [Deltaproteobacteria bacterium]|nr:hypothetical protein [Deltaproteobacteria bacterium]MBK8241190.1 hypothetical protein [Deltaproteobacteria bacterium]MBK8716888.1 hypothetical protein [Deltaproteobacteria bacterium]MBP7286992.1 hypothetical protein [Nannocystaceae bacterium]